MGAWGPGVFENDEAMDWLGEMLESDSVALIQEALSSAVVDRSSFIQKLFGKKFASVFLEADLASQALAAAEVVAALQGKACSNAPEGLDMWVDRNRSRISSDLIQVARAAVERVQASSELKELWSESQEFPQWEAGLSDLRQRLNG